MPAAYIDDGYTLTKTLEDTPFYPRTVIQYRPMLSREQRHFNLKIENAERDTNGRVTEAGITKAEKLAAEMIAAKIVEWSITRPDGEPVKICGAEFERLEPHLAGAIVNAVLGNLPPDGEPEPPTGKTSEDVDSGN